MIERTVDHVLVATDLSTRSGRAVQRAALIAQAHRAHLTVVHIVDPSVDDLSVAEARQLVEGQTSELDPQPTIEVGMGAPFVEIIRRARAGDAALIVLGARGQHSLGEQLVGTTAERVVRNGDRPVLVVRRFPQGDQYQEVLIGIDRSDRSAEALGFARRTFPGARLTAATICVVVGERRLQLAGASEAEMDSLRRATTARERERTEVWLAEQSVRADSFALFPGRPSVGWRHLPSATTSISWSWDPTGSPGSDTSFSAASPSRCCAIPRATSWSCGVGAPPVSSSCREVSATLGEWPEHE